jgi:hypothetical protein
MHDALSSRFGHRPPATGASPEEIERTEALRCSICTGRLGDEVAYLDETGDVPAPRQSWTLCPTCDEAVREELARSPIQGPLRVRIAVGLVAAERSPNALRAPRTAIGDERWLSFLFWGFGIAMVLHLLVIAWIASLHH